MKIIIKNNFGGRKKIKQIYYKQKLHQIYYETKKCINTFNIKIQETANNIPRFAHIL